MVQSSAVEAGVVPVENSLAGSIAETYDLLISHDLFVTGETTLPVEHCLLALPGTELTQIQEVLSHPQALAQCNDYLVQLGVECVPYYDTAGAAKHVKRSGLLHAAAIASQWAAEVYGLQVLVRGIQSNRDNYTRFYRIERMERPGGRRNRTVFAVGLPHCPGSLVTALSSFSNQGVNLTKIESRPVRAKPWQYIFYLEYEGHVEDPGMQSALEDLRARVAMLRILGSFPVEE